MTNNRVMINEERAFRVFQTLEQQYIEGEGLFQSKAHLIENQIPIGVNRSSDEHARFLFFTALNDHGLKSATMYQKAKDLYAKHPEYFDPQCIAANYSEDSYIDLIPLTAQKLGARYPTALAKAWYRNAVTLLADYNGNPVNLFRSSNDATIVLKNIKSFTGIGAKIGGMLLRAAIGLGWTLNDLNRTNEVLVPVDIHDSRIMFLTGIFAIEDINVEDIDYYAYRLEASKVITAVCGKYNCNWENVDRALWLTGSEGCTAKSQRCDICSIRQYCIKSKNGNI